jgi:hypothetical protein
MAPKRFRMKISELHPCSGPKVPAKEQIIARVLHMRDGLAGAAPKWESWLIDEDRAEGVLLLDAWGKHIPKAKKALKFGYVYAITNYVVLTKGKSMPFGNNGIKLTWTDKMTFTEMLGEHTDIPKSLPLDSIDDVVALQVTRVVSLIVRVHTPGQAQERALKSTGKSKSVTNLCVKAQTSKLELAAWGSHAKTLSGKTGDFRLDAITAIPSPNSDSVKLGTMDCSYILPATGAETLALESSLAAEQDLIQLTKETYAGSKMQTEMAKQANITNLELLALSLDSQFDATSAGVGEAFDGPYVIPSVMVMNTRGTDYANDDMDLTYKACPSCKFKKLNEDGICDKCKGTAFDVRYLFHCTIADPTNSVEGVCYHECATELLENDEDSLLKPHVALVHLGPDARNPGRHCLEMLSFRPMFTDDGVLNVFRTPPARFHSSGDKVMPTTPSAITTNAMSQTIVHKTYCNHVRLLLKITTVKACTTMEDGVDGMRCKQDAQCLVSLEKVTLTMAGSFDAVQPLYRLSKKQIVHALCSPAGSDGDVPNFRPDRLYCIGDEDTNSVIKAFKFEVAQVKAHFHNEQEALELTGTPDMKRKAEENQPLKSRRWASPQRRLKLAKTEDARDAGVAADT